MSIDYLPSDPVAPSQIPMTLWKDTQTKRFNINIS